jgi:sugar phosphate isomerase/epimerase
MGCEHEDLKMNLMICMRGEPDQLPFLPEIAELGAGIELGSYGLIGVQSERDWEARFARHQAVRTQFQGTIAIHGPFIGMEYGHIDHLIRDVVNHRLDMTFDVAVKLKARRVVLHSGYGREYDLFKMKDLWLKNNAGFWKQGIGRWADAGIEIALENETDQVPDLLVKLVDEVNNPSFGICFDIGHAHLFSELDASEWVRRMDHRLLHVHLHDNDGKGDCHWPLGRGTIDFEPFYAALLRHAAQATISLEVEDKLRMEVKMADLRKLAAHFTSKQRSTGVSS